MSAFTDFWDGLGQRARAAFAAGVVAILAAAIAAGYWLTRTDYQVLFADLSARDSAAMLAELDKAKVPYRVGESGGTILVPADVVHATRMKLVSKELPLQGGVGFELFNSSDVGVTDFAQKVNYLRALQGELSRTIMSIEGVQSARVHVVLPEQGLFKKPGAQAKASVTLSTREGRRLESAQIRGVQRLVAAAVPEIRAEDVTLVDQRGMALNAAADGGEGAPSDLADGRRELEEYLARKATEVLDQAFGERHSIVRVDAQLNLDQTKVTTESVLPSNVPGSSRPAGVMVRENETATGGAGTGADATPGTPRNREVLYQVGRRVEQVVSRPGAVNRLHVAVIIKSPLDEQQLARVKDLVSAAVGLNKLRGDALAVYAMDQLAPAAATSEAPTAAAPLAVPDHEPAAPAWPMGGDAVPAVLLWGMAGLAALAVAAAVAARQRIRPAPPAGRGALSLAERQAVLEQVQRWMEPARIGQSAEHAR